MRAIYLSENLIVGEAINIDGDKAHHFYNVLRLRVGDKILVLSGAGVSSIAEIEAISKRFVSIKCLEQETHETPKLQIDLGISKLKKDAMDSVLKAACELGIMNIHILDSEYSQNYPLKPSRLEKLLISGLEQSNNPFMPNIYEGKIFDINFNEYSKIFLFSSPL